MLLVIDKGHGDGTDNGAAANGLIEAELNDIIVEGVIKRLSFYECEVRLAPRSESLSERAAFANDAGADFFLSIHCNAGGGTGFESYVYTSASAEAERVRGHLHKCIMEAIAPWSVKDRGKKAANFAVLRETDMPAVLLECLFVDNVQNAELLRADSFLSSLSNGIAWGLVVAFDLKKKAVVDCNNCQRYKDVAAERDKYYAEANKMRQELKCIAGKTMPYLANGA